MKNGNVLDQFVEFEGKLLIAAKKIWPEFKGSKAQEWIRNDKSLERALRSALLTPKNKYLKCVSVGKETIFGPTDGNGTTLLAKDVFDSIEFKDFKNHLDVSSEPTEEMGVEVFELIKDGTPEEIFNGFKENLECLCFTPSQTKLFCKDQTWNDGWISTDITCALLFFKAENEFFVISVFVDIDAGACATIDHLSSKDETYDSQRKVLIIIPQL